MSLFTQSSVDRFSKQYPSYFVASFLLIVSYSLLSLLGSNLLLRGGLLDNLLGGSLLRSGSLGGLGGGLLDGFLSGGSLLGGG